MSGAVAALIAPSPAWGVGKTYEVVQCDPLNRNVDGLEMQDAPAYAVKQKCADPKNDHAIKITNTRFATHGGRGQVHWSTGSPVLRIVGVNVQAWLRRDKGHAARLFVADAEGHELARVAAGPNEPTDFKNYSWRSSGVRPEQFVARLRCESNNGCRHSDVAKTWVRNVHFRVADYADPTLQNVSGTVFGTAWLQGSQSLVIGGSDIGAGISRIYASVNGRRIGGQDGKCSSVSGTTFALSFEPCPSQLDVQRNLQTSAAPFRDGANAMVVCVVDFAANRTCVHRTVRVDNTPPFVAFTNDQSPNDPELIKAYAFDATSGVTTGRIYYRPVGSGPWRPLETRLGPGELRARVDSTLDPPGRYEFMAMVRDAAGNAALSIKHLDGRPMRLTFPLKSGVHLTGHLTGGASRLTVDYGQTSRVSGTLTDASGEPLPSQEVTVTEYFGDGALIDRRVRTVLTDGQGHWEESLPAGPSRKIAAKYAGTRRYLADVSGIGRLQVRTKATLRLSHRKVSEGHRVAFKGKVGHLAARIPAGGKLVELEVKDGHSWQTVEHPFYTRPNGKYRLRYRFARFYTSNVRYRFRVRVLREHEWPYKAPAKSRIRKLVVKAR